MASRLYDQAMRYQQTKLWKKLRENEPFAVKLQSGEIGYCSVLGRSCNQIGLIVFTGTEGLEYYQELRQSENIFPDPTLFRGNTEPNYILFTLEKRDDLSLEEYTALKACAKSNGFRLKNADLLPKFICHLSNSVPWPLESVSEMEEMAEILEAACSLNNMLATGNKAQIGFDADCGQMPMLVRNAGGFDIEVLDVAACRESTPEPPGRIRDFLIMQLKKLPRKQTLETELIRLPDLVKGKDSAIPYYPSALLSVIKENRFVLEMSIAEGRVYNADELLASFVHTLLGSRVYPKKIEVRTAATALLLEGFCSQANIQLRRLKMLPELDDTMRKLENYLSNQM